jgi:hypothetical protein
MHVAQDPDTCDHLHSFSGDLDDAYDGDVSRGSFPLDPNHPQLLSAASHASGAAYPPHSASMHGPHANSEQPYRGAIPTRPPGAAALNADPRYPTHDPTMHGMIPAASPDSDADGADDGALLNTSHTSASLLRGNISGDTLDGNAGVNFVHACAEELEASGRLDAASDTSGEQAGGDKEIDGDACMQCDPLCTPVATCTCAVQHAVKVFAWLRVHA